MIYIYRTKDINGDWRQYTIRSTNFLDFPGERGPGWTANNCPPFDNIIKNILFEIYKKEYDENHIFFTYIKNGFGWCRNSKIDIQVFINILDTINYPYYFGDYTE